MKRQMLWAFSLAAFLWFALPSPAATVRDVRTKMGSRYEITAVHTDRTRAQDAIDAAYREIDRLEAMISSWRSDRETAAVNAGAGRDPVPVTPELFGLIQRSLKVSALTDGAFDITFAGVGQLWDFKAAEPALPDPQTIAEAIALVNWRDVVLDAKWRTVFLKRPGMRIGFGAIGKGFSANRAAIVLKEHGIGGGVVNAGGDLFAFGVQENGQAWRTAIADPRRRYRIFARLALTDRAVVTSGDYERFIIENLVAAEAAQLPKNNPSSSIYLVDG